MRLTKVKKDRLIFTRSVIELAINDYKKANMVINGKITGLRNGKKYLELKKMKHLKMCLQ